MSRSWRLGTLLVGGGVTLGGLGIGLAMTAAANGASSSVDALRVGDGSPSACYRSKTGPCEALAEAVTEMETFTAVAGIGYAIAISAAVGTSLLLLLPPPPPRPRASLRPSARVTPWFGPGGGGVGVVGVF
ncbi:uncharacterized protein CMC5_063970 [Chondromyces crocatus]|uniref:Uncharacterized protein n=1 Tax=Chondromyces crocatus TaxID=52 RepID=A0A0K1EMV2_CHOCO|nr:uncharacterized protein CMC5_063970 [Chondromyces crocatus]